MQRGLGLSNRVDDRAEVVDVHREPVVRNVLEQRLTAEDAVRVRLHEVFGRGLAVLGRASLALGVPRWQVGRKHLAPVAAQPAANDAGSRVALYFGEHTAQVENARHSAFFDGEPETVRRAVDRAVVAPGLGHRGSA